MPTIRSHFSFAQFKEQLQNFAYDMACETVNEPLRHGRIRIIMEGQRVVELDTSEYTIKFYASHVQFSKNVRKPCKQEMYQNGKWVKVDAFRTEDLWSFDIEEKEYQNSNHRSKISFSGYGMFEYDAEQEKTVTLQKKVAEIQRNVQEFIDQLMAGVTPIPRFKLEQVQ
jgi:hypothetical protein